MPTTNVARITRIAAGASLAAAGLLACGDDGSSTASPTETIESQAAALRDGDCEEAMALTVDNDPDAIADCESQIGDGLDIEVLDATIADETDESAEVQVTFSEDGKETERTITLQLVDDEWLID